MSADLAVTITLTVQSVPDALSFNLAHKIHVRKEFVLVTKQHTNPQNWTPALLLSTGIMKTIHFKLGRIGTPLRILPWKFVFLSRKLQDLQEISACCSFLYRFVPSILFS
jgi:hypothetical protein